MQEDFIVTARIRRMTESNVFTLSTISGGGVPHHRSVGGGYPIPGLDGEGYPSQIWMVGVPQPGLDGRGYLGYPPRPGLDGGEHTWGTPPPPPPILDGVPPPRQSSIASTCYAAGGMPLAFMQEDFLVFEVGRKAIGYHHLIGINESLYR